LIADGSFTPNINGNVNFIEILSDGKILIAGDFTVVNGVQRNKIARLNQDGSLDASFNANSVIVMGEFLSPLIRSMEVLPDGKILLAGAFGNGSPIEFVKSVLRLNADGTFDSSLTSIPQIRNGINLYVQKAEQLPNGKILICGNFTEPNGNPQPKLARYNSNGTYDSTFTTTINSDCQDVEAQPDGKYFVAGGYTTVNGSPRAHLTRFNPDDGVDASFTAAPMTTPHNAPVEYRQIDVRGDGKIVAFRGSFRSGVVSLLNPDGSHHITYPGYIDTPGKAVFQSNGKAMVAAEYVSNNQYGMSNDFNRFNTDGSHDASLHRDIGLLGSSFPTFLQAAAVTADGKVLIGGNFTGTNIRGVVSNQKFLARLAPQAIPIKPKYDFDGDGKDDVALFRPSNFAWYLNQSTSGFYAAQFGLSTDKPVAADYDGDGRADIAVFRDGVWYWLRSSNFTLAYGVTGRAGDIPQPGFNDSSPFYSLLVFRPSTANFYVHQPYQNEQILEFRDMTLLPTDKPVVADYDGDGISDLAVFRGGNWFVMRSGSLSTVHYQFGLAGDKPVVGDFDGDLRTDYGVYRPSEGTWYIQRTHEGFSAVRWGLADDLPVPADYNGDGKTDIAVYRPSEGMWYQLRSDGSFHFERFGLAEDIPAQLRLKN
jgi:uncharacterized delta-60 repeat protein